jgi:5-formyltetrahydrofolate cyclo-ligase
MRHSEHIRALLQAGFPQFSGMRVGFCWPFNKEPDLRPLIESWVGDGRQGFAALLPVVIDENRALAFRAWSPDTAMVIDRMASRRRRQVIS